MALKGDLRGLGLPPDPTNLLGYARQTVAGAGTTAATATDLEAGASFVALTTGASATGVKLHSLTPFLRPIIITNTSATTAIVYPPTDGQINGGTATTGGQNVAVNKTAIYIRTGANTWVSVLTA